MLKRNLLHIFILCLVMGSPTAVPRTADADNMANLTARELKELLDSGTPIFLLNPLSQIEFNEGHIPGSVNIPAEELLTTKRLPQDKEMHIITYCKGPKWVLYKQAASLVANRLHKNISTFKGGLPAWKKAGYPLDKSRALPKYDIPGIDGEQFKLLVGEACLVDIRTPKLYGQGNIKAKFGPKADTLSKEYKRKYFLKIPMSRLAAQYDKIPMDRKVVVFDFRGKQSNMAARFLRHHGYNDICILNGGIAAVPE